jgi:hypothetical protein
MLQQLQIGDIPKLMQDLIANDTTTDLKTDAVTETCVFICSHNSRDARCGVCGPALFKEFKQQLLAQDTSQSPILISKCSHVGGHQVLVQVCLIELLHNVP